MELYFVRIKSKESIEYIIIKVNFIRIGAYIGVPLGTVLGPTLFYFHIIRICLVTERSFWFSCHLIFSITFASTISVWQNHIHHSIILKLALSQHYTYCSKALRVTIAWWYNLNTRRQRVKSANKAWRWQGTATCWFTIRRPHQES